MKRVYAGQDGITVDYLQGLLEGRGIRCLVRNQYLQGAAGELPVNECWPEIWVLNDDDVTLASDIVNGALASDSSSDPWRCPGCGETLEAQFDQCWHCGGRKS